MGLFSVFTWFFDFISRSLVLLNGFKKQREEEGNVDKGSIDSIISEYTNLHEKEESDRTDNYAWFVNAYYNVSTVFYEWAWGSSFHFAPRKPYETFNGAILRHEMRLADRLGIKENSKVLDIGCGIGGPLINIAKNTGSCSTGLNNNAYQISRANELLKEAGLTEKCNFVKGDFCNMTFAEDNTYDVCYAIESTCHSPSRNDVYEEVFRVLKPGGYFGGYEWVLTDRHRDSNPEHVKAAKNVQIGNGLPGITSYKVCLEALKDTGFEVLDYEDFFANRAGDELPWWFELEGSYSRPFSTFQFLPIGKFIYFHLLTFFEKIGFAPIGTCKVSQMLHIGGEGLVAGGRMGTFTPGYFFLARKPEAKGKGKK